MKRYRHRMIYVLMILSILLASGFPTQAQTTQLVLSGEQPALASQFHVSPLKEEARLESAHRIIDPSTGDEILAVIVQLRDQPVASYEGGVAGLAATSPRVTGQRVDKKKPAVKAYTDYLQGRQEQFKGQARTVAPGLKVTHQYQIALNAVALQVPLSQLASLMALPEVHAIYPDELLQPETEGSPNFIGAPVAWDALGGQQSAGEGVIVGVLDTGIWPEHPSFADPDPSGKAYPAPPGGPYTCDFGNTAANTADAPFACNNKLIGAYSFLDTYKTLVGLEPSEFDSARDSDGHGTHTASTAAGNPWVEAIHLGVNRGLVSGIAPRAHVIAYRVCGIAGCYQSDSAAAVEQAILDGVDVINFSISGGTSPYSDVVSLAFLNAYANGVFVAASAGNSGPAANTVNHRGPWVTTVAASTQSRAFGSTLHLMAAENSLTLTGASVTAGISAPTAVVFPPAGQELCLNPFAPGTFNGEIVICERGVIARVAKGYNVLAGGAGGMILYNPALQGTSVDNHFLPSIHIEHDAGAALLSFMASNTDVTATFSDGSATAGQGDVMAAFSSRGGTGLTLGVAKPDITAPGVQILAGQTPMPGSQDGGPSGELFQAIQGTSMSSPHVAGAAALIKAINPGWTPGMIKSALMTSALGSVVKEDRATIADPFDYGSGRLNLARAGSVSLTFDETAANFLAMQSNLWDANYPSLYFPSFPGVATVSRTLKNHLPTANVVRTRVTAPRDLKVTVPRNLSVPGGGQLSFAITVDARSVPLGEVRHALIEFVAQNETLRFPVTVLRKEPELTMTKSCDPTTLARGAEADCSITITNTSRQEATFDLVDRLPQQLSVVEETVFGAIASGRTVRASGTLAGAQPPDVTVGAGGLYGYIPLGGFAIAPMTGVGDETISNFNVPAFTYAGETYTRLGVVSNGYVVVGGGTGADVSYINTNFPNPSRPNNVLAPFWTDLNPAAGGAMRIAILSAGPNRWIVAEWSGVPNWSNHAQVNSFQVWIQLDGPEGITFAYNTVSGGDGGYLTVGAENKDGTRGQAVYFDGTGTAPTAGGELRVTTVPGAPGGTHLITYRVRANSTGKWTNCAELTSNLFAGTSTSCISGQVTR